MNPEIFATPQTYADLQRIVPDRNQLDSVLLCLVRSRRIRVTAKGYALPPVPPKEDPEPVPQTELMRLKREYDMRRREKLAARKVIYCKGCGKRKKAVHFAKCELVWPKPLCYPCKNRGRK